MAQLSKEQQAKYHKLLKNRGPEVAQQYDQWIQAGKPGGTFNPNNPVTPGAPAGTPPSVDLNNPQSVLNYQAQVNDKSVTQSTPNVVNDFGSRTVTTDPVTGQKTVTEGTTGKNKELMEQGQANQGLINNQFEKQIGYANEQGKFDPRKGQIEQKAFDTASVGNLPEWQDPRKTAIQAPGSFRDMQQQTYRNALDDYTSSVREDQSFRRDALEQQMANEGIPRDSVKYQRAMAQFEKTANEGINRATRAAYRDSMDVGSQAFKDQLSGQGQEFNQNYSTGEQRFNQAYNARGQDAGFQAQQFGQQGQLNDRAERMTQSEYMMPHQIAGQYMGAQGQFKDPNMGPTQSINTPTMDVFGYGTSYNNAQQQGNQFGQTMDFNRWKAQGDWNTSRSTAGAGKTSLADSIALQNNASQNQMNNWYAQQGYGGNQGPQQPSWGDAGGNFMGGVVNGVTNGMINNGRR